MKIIASPHWKETYPGACCGFLAVRNVSNPPSHPALEQRKLELERDLRGRYADKITLQADPVLQAYAAYYKRFKKTYHVALQLESVAQKGKSIPSVAALVECMFMAELQNRLLTAGHDLDLVQMPVTIHAAMGDERYTTLRGTEQVLKANDMYMADTQGILSNVIYGPDQRSQITPVTRSALFAVYAPEGIGAGTVRQHLETILEYVRIVSPDAVVEGMEVIE